MERSEIGARSLAAPVTELGGDLARGEEVTALISSKAKGDFNSADSLRLIAEALEAEKPVLEDSFRDLEVLMGDLESKNLKTVEDALRKEELIKSPNIVLDVLSGVEITAEKKEHGKFSKMQEELKECKKMRMVRREKYCAVLRKKENEIADLYEKLVFAKEKANMDRIEKEMAWAMNLRKNDKINYLEEKLKDALGGPYSIVSLKESSIETFTQRERVKGFLIEYLSRAWGNARKWLEMEKKAISALAEKEREALSLKQELLLARLKVMDELEAENMELVANKDAGKLLVKDHLNQIVVQRMKNKNLEKEINHLKDMNSELEVKDNDDVLVRGTHLTDGKRSEISWVSTAAVIVSSGTFAVIIASCLHLKKQN